MIDLTAQLAAQLTGYFAYDHNFKVENLRKINFVTAANGMFRVEKTPIGIFSQRVSEVKEPIPGLQPLTEGFQLTIPKIPFKYISMALSFYQDVNTKDKTEASLLFFWNYQNKTLPTQYTDGKPIKGLLVDGQLIVYVPVQTNTATLSKFGGDTMVDWLRQNTALLCETHSHNTMGAFFSSTDDANENMTQCYFVWGKVTSPQPEFAFRYVSGKMKNKTCPSVLFDWPVIRERKIVKTEYVGCTGPEVPDREEYVDTIYKGPFEKLSYPLEWMEQHSKQAYTSTTSRGPWGGSKWNGQYGAKANGYDEEEHYGQQSFDHYNQDPYLALANGYDYFEDNLGNIIPFHNPEMSNFLITEYNMEENMNLKDVMLDIGAIIEDFQFNGISEKIQEAMLRQDHTKLSKVKDNDSVNDKGKGKGKNKSGKAKTQVQ
jgi:hypothetical protein